MRRSTPIVGGSIRSERASAWAMASAGLTHMLCSSSVSSWAPSCPAGEAARKNRVSKRRGLSPTGRHPVGDVADRAEVEHAVRRARTAPPSTAPRRARRDGRHRRPSPRRRRRAWPAGHRPPRSTRARQRPRRPVRRRRSRDEPKRWGRPTRRSARRSMRRHRPRRRGRPGTRTSRRRTRTPRHAAGRTPPRHAARHL